MTQPVNRLPTASPVAEARAQAEAYGSAVANTLLELEGGGTVSVPPHPDMNLLDDDRLDEYNELLFERDTRYMRDPDIIVPEQERDGVVHPSEIIRGDLQLPYRWADEGVDVFGVEHAKGQMVKPSWSIRVVKAALGESEFKKLKDGGRNAADVVKIWTQKGLDLRVRQFLGSESTGSSVDLETISEADSQ